jgi:hypothetical protein
MGLKNKMMKPLFFLFSLFGFLACAFMSGVEGSLTVAYVSMVMSLVSFGMMWFSIWELE